ncbi:hypothetical protein I1A49_00460 [Streptomyces malaysiensis subsp. malaysiensis]|uniref:AMP-binding enzyme C-terminal domain-containing protein n=1 Tax=Streptomyces malaysiensis TaxID=92644 RepID=A0ABX6VVY8_STRMQ|nr:hypothetical protein I1A49_00460 [Streptomyces solisilvae]
MSSSSSVSHGAGVRRDHADHRRGVARAPGIGRPALVRRHEGPRPKLLSSVVVGLPDDDLGQRAHAIVQAEPGTTARELLDFLVDRLVRYKIPRSVEFTDRPPRDDSGKV